MLETYIFTCVVANKGQHIHRDSTATEDTIHLMFTNNNHKTATSGGGCTNTFHSDATHSDILSLKTMEQHTHCRVHTDFKLPYFLDDW